MTTFRSIFPAALLAACAIQTPAQTQVPNPYGARGTLPYGTYTTGQLDSIDTVYGVLTYRIPMATLAPGFAGLSAGVPLIYNSSVFDVDPTYGEILSPTGGWRYGYQYGMSLTVAGGTSCSGSSPDSFQLSATFPDGSAHLLHLYGAWETNGNGYYSQLPGVADPCHPLTDPANGNSLTDFTYYTDDGTYLRVVISGSQGTTCDPSGAWDCWQTHPWTMYFKDGSQVTGTGLYSGTMSDPNGNTIQVQNLETDQGPQTALEDNLYRPIWINHQGAANSVDYVTAFGANNSILTWTIQWEALGDRENVVKSLQLPATVYNGYQYTPQFSFGYETEEMEGDPWERLNSVTMPSGATTSYTYGSPVSSPQDPVASKTVTWCDESDLGAPVQSLSGCATPRTDTWSFLYYSSEQTIVTAPDGGKTTYNFYDTSPYAGFSTGAGLVYNVAEPDGSVTDRRWAWNEPFDQTNGGSSSPKNPYVLMEAHSAASGGGVGSNSPAEVTSVSVDRNGNVLAKNEYDWVTRSSLVFNSSPGVAPGDLSLFQNGLPSPSRVTTQQMNVVTNNTYNNSGQNDPNGYWNPSFPRLLFLPTCRSITGYEHGSVTEFSYDSNGNTVQERDWDSTKAPSQPTCGASPVLTAGNGGNAVGQSWNYDLNGDVTDYYDGMGNRTHTVYANSDIPTPFPQYVYQAYGMPLQRVSSYIYDYYASLPNAATDYNGLTTDYFYDNLGRQTQVQERGSAMLRETSTAYDDANRRVISTSDRVSGGDQQLVSVTDYDWLGRVRLTRQLENSGSQSPNDDTAGIKVQTRYSAGQMGAAGTDYQLVSNPYRAATSAAESADTMGWTLTTTANNSGGRSVTMSSFTGSGLPSPFSSSANPPTSGSVSTVYSVSSSPLGVASTVTDQGGKSRTTLFDGMGRMEQVTENGVVNGVTTYRSDLLDNIQEVRTQGSSFGCTGAGAPYRSFSYDSLSRLQWTCNPENGVISYGYYDNGNLFQRQDAAGKYSTSYYDALNRVTSKTYSDGTPTVSWTYAGTNQTQDFLASESAGNTTYSYSGYDVLGRPGATTQTTNSAPYSFTGLQWTPEGQMASVTYPSGRVVATAFDGAGRPNSLTGTLNGTPTYYAAGIAYAAHGGLTQLNTGDGVSRAIDYNARLQVSSLGASLGAGSLLSLNYSYGTSATTNNGNLSIENVTRPGLNVQQSFGYDAANRLTYAGENSGWSQQYVYDAMGNRAVTASAYIPSANFTPQTSGSTVPYDVHNHWLGAGYDSSGNGNMTSLVSQSLQYDAENRLISLNDSGAVTSFTYDGDGRRVTKTSGGTTTTYVYGPDGQLAAEIGGPAPPVSGTLYVTTDRMGSTRLVTNGSGGVVGCADYLPFGEAIPATVSGWGRDQVPCYAAASGTDVGYVGQLFDTETGLSYFNARYLRASMGSFITADEPLNDQWGDDPQSWHLHAYARNNPLRFGDPSGQTVTICAPDCTPFGISDDEYQSQQDLPWYLQGGLLYPSISELEASGGVGSITDTSGNTLGEVYWTCDNPGICGAANRAGAAQIGSSQTVINYFAAASVAAGVASGGLIASGAVDALIGGAEFDSIVGPGRAVNYLLRANNSKLRNIIKLLYRVQATLGDGGTADAVRYTKMTGELVGGSDHIQKASEVVSALTKLLNSGNLSVSDHAIAIKLLNDLKDALK